MVGHAVTHDKGAIGRTGHIAGRQRLRLTGADVGRHALQRLHLLIDPLVAPRTAVAQLQVDAGTAVCPVPRGFVADGKPVAAHCAADTNATTRFAALHVLPHGYQQAALLRIDDGQHSPEVCDVGGTGADDDLALHAAQGTAGFHQRTQDRDHLIHRAEPQRNDFHVSLRGTRAQQQQQEQKPHGQFKVLKRNKLGVNRRPDFNVITGLFDDLKAFLTQIHGFRPAFRAFQ